MQQMAPFAENSKDTL